MDSSEVFKPDDLPKHTYVERIPENKPKREVFLKSQLKRSGAIISVSGPSKTGKSKLIEHVAGMEDYQLIKVFGNNVAAADDVWNGALDALSEPHEVESSESTSNESGVIARIKGRTGLLDGEVEGEVRKQESEGETELHARRGLIQLVESVDLESTVLVIEDFHNIDESVQNEIGPALKEASERGLKTCVLVIAHKSDVIVDSVDDLTDRVQSITFDYWDQKDLREIGKKGFGDALNLDVPEGLINKLAEEAVRSPYLMQQLCYNACPIIGITERQSSLTSVDVSNDDIEMILRQTASSLENNYRKIFKIMDGQTFTGGSRRNKIEFVDGVENDIYRAMIRAIAAEPIQTSFDQEDLISRINEQVETITRVSDGEQINQVNPGSIISAYKRVDEKISETKPNSEILDWDEDEKELTVGKTGLILYLRWCDRLNVDRSVDAV